MSTQGGTELRTRGNSYAKLDDRAKLERLLEGDSPDGVDYATFLIHNGIPWNSIFLAIFLLGTGCTLLVFGTLMVKGHFKSDNNNGWDMIFLGCLTFLPGFYESRIAYYTYRQSPGYSYSHIPGV
mmetsp:Transcript_32126/g.53975  ORF Transcript_32126/g.53975 Transcript_32126/m.53975 type:complete len:125 (+) Transcript_32126:103-477(+)